VSRLDAEVIARELARRGAALGRPLSVVDRTSSTNDDARRAAIAGAAHGAAFLADEQTAGRGRYGHGWHSPPGDNLYLSIVLRPRVPAAAAAPIGLACGLAVAAVAEQALARAGIGAVQVALKWPNDVIAGGGKLAGVLVEGQVRGDALQSLIVGVGLNVRTRCFPPEIAHRAVSLSLLGCDPPREALAADLLEALGHAVGRFEAHRLTSFAGDLVRRDWLRGRRVAVGDVVGIASGIDPDGRLLIQRGDGVVCPVAAGEASVVLG
jgi:BirA family biotin operon repressor/biotin-[acetyl-CoA-carboxylase] ligase